MIMQSSHLRDSFFLSLNLWKVRYGVALVACAFALCGFLAVGFLTSELVEVSQTFIHNN